MSPTFLYCHLKHTKPKGKQSTLEEEMGGMKNGSVSWS